jgi:hypothetical protein|tara:strand:+ start:5426 stop:5677 length:252 start_codon:yes stop_codon:yes gene_type:complete
MAYERIDIQLAIPQEIFDKIPSTKKKAFRDMVRAWKAKAVKINDGLSNEEMTVTAVRHTCYHDDPTVGGQFPLGKPCEPRVEI